MKSKTFKILGVIGIVIVLFLTYAIWQYNKPHLNIKQENASLFLTIDELIEEFQNDEFKASEKYTDKIIQIKGTIFDISLLEGNSVITLKNNDQIVGIHCNMNPEDNLKSIKLKKGDIIEIKGICTGFLLDIVMVKCVLINNN